MNVLIQQTLRESNGRGESRLSSFDWLYVANLRVTNRENVADLVISSRIACWRWIATQ